MPVNSILSQPFFDDRIDCLLEDQSICLVDYVDQIMEKFTFWAFGYRAGLDDVLSVMRWIRLLTLSIKFSLSLTFASLR